jgi:hypothetical protein
MTLVSGTATRYDMKGLRESLHDRIYNISPEETPFISGAGRGPAAKQTLEEWQTDSLAAADGTNAQLEGDDASFSTPAASTRVGNYTQIMRKTLILSDTLEQVDKAGRRSELAYQLAKRGAELKRDTETVVLRAQAGDAGGTGTARTLAALNAWVKTNVDFYTTDGGNPTYTSGVPSAVRTDGGTLRNFTETIGKNVIQSCWTAGANPGVLMVGPHNKQYVSANWTGIATRNYDLSNVAPRSMAAIASIDVYVNDFGVLRVIPNRFQRERDAWFLDFDYVELRYLRPLRQTKLAKTGDAEKRMMIQELTLVVKQEAALGLAADLVTA